MSCCHLNLVWKKRNKYPVTLSDELGGVELGDDGLEDLVDNGRENPLIVIHPKGAEDFWELVHLWPGEHTERDVHHLQI